MTKKKSSLKVCIDKWLPPELVQEASERAIAENPDNSPSVDRLFHLAAFRPAIMHPIHLAIATGKKWQPGRTIRVAFMDGQQSVKAKVEAYARKWLEFANLQFDFSGSGQADVRISFRQEGSWSYLGTDCLSIPQNQPTMNYGWLNQSTPEAEYERVVVHEWGHALGAVHEHASPAGGINWNKEAAYAYYGRQGWSRQMVDQQVFQKYSQTQTQYTALDPNSIMMYPIPPGLTTDGFSTPGGQRLTQADKDFIAKMYPGVAPPPPPPPTGGDWKKVQEAIDLLKSALPQQTWTITTSSCLSPVPRNMVI